MHEHLTARSLSESTIVMVCGERDRSIEGPQIINFINLISWVFDNPEFKEIYMMDPNFHNIIDYISRGATAPELLTIIKDLCKSNNDMRNELVEVAMNAPPRPIIIQK